MSRILLNMYSVYFQDCGKCFARSHHLKRHINCIHKGIKFSESKTQVMSGIANQTFIPTSTSSVTKLQQQTATLYSGSHQIETDITDNETVFVTTEDDGAGGTVTFVQNIKGENISKDGEMVETEYVIEDNLPATTVEIDNGKFLFSFSSLSYIRELP